MLDGEIWGKFLEADVQDAPLHGGLLRDVCFRRVKSWGV